MLLHPQFDSSQDCVALRSDMEGAHI